MDQRSALLFARGSERGESGFGSASLPWPLLISSGTSLSHPALLIDRRRSPKTNPPRSEGQTQTRVSTSARTSKDCSELPVHEIRAWAVWRPLWEIDAETGLVIQRADFLAIDEDPVVAEEVLAGAFPVERDVSGSHTDMMPTIGPQTLNSGEPW
jgi:hypothetical protein